MQLKTVIPACFWREVPFGSSIWIGQLIFFDYLIIPEHQNIFPVISDTFIKCYLILIFIKFTLNAVQ